MPHPPVAVSLCLPMASRPSDCRANWTEATECLECGGRLEFHQPDAQRPDRMLGVCEECHRWSIVEVDAGRAGVNLVLLPDRFPVG